MTARAFALFVGLWTSLNLSGDLLWPGFDASIWWIYFAGLPPGLAKAFLAVSALTLLVFALRQPGRNRWPRLAVGVPLVLAAVAVVNVITFYWLIAAGRIRAGFPLPFSLLVCLGMLHIAHAARSPHLAPLRVAPWQVVAGGLVLFGLFPLAQILCFGNTDYRRPADAVVVFGARAYADGRVSDALEDRMRTACQLYRAGLTRRVVLSGGPGDGAIHETEAMRRYALAHGVPTEHLFTDTQGLSTAATVRNTVPLFHAWHANRVLAVSHFYHLPRIKLSYQRAGFEVCTVPARQKYVLRQIPYSMAREVAAFWAYYFQRRPDAGTQT